MIKRLDLGSLSETVDSLVGHEGLGAQPSEEITIGGALAFRFTADPSVQVRIAKGACSSGGKCGFWVADVNGKTVTFVLFAISSAEFEKFRPGAETIIDSIVWKDLP